MQKTKIKKKSDLSPKKRGKSALGRGLDSLLPDIDIVENSSKEYFLCDVGLIRSNRYQPRRQFSKDELDELSRSIKEHGMIQPLLVRKDATGYELIAGERRLRAAKMAGLDKVPVVIKDISDENMLEISIVENIQREDLNAMEEAEAYHRLMIEFNLTQDQVALRVGKSRPTITNFLRLRQLPEEIKSSIMDNSLAMGHARALLGAGTSVQQRAAWQAVVSKGLSVRETEALIKRLKSEKKKPKKSKPGSEEIYFKDLAEDFSRRLGTKVQIKKHGQKGKVIIDFYTNDDLDRLIGIFKRI
ncbi:MAG: ParB/RepB/Spo0J family partition protein [Desulfobacterales bacterium]|uniref:ParB/RepB/Spo0J family partition protein n=1 Tax=Candidatus Desulfaltia bathyphila TaxID=2841697 RepID=A0A8J6N530_9BACT|nr:ParB/RepB/Spo0J family partition protein [Candidatus Desulfaltia bathyphila]MBL7195922.1 ParB/RepB/Spo0J family partition protein [Desulfobacterales bacterium]MBL7208074.1 ParB/RepB/Spo0J family partition protein [Desulfobacterales bacterium]